MDDDRIYPEDIEELLDRVRRIETRLTRYMTENGFDTHAQRPRYYPTRQALVVPSRNVSLADCLRALPDGVKSVEVFIGRDRIAQLII